LSRIAECQNILNLQGQILTLQNNLPNQVNIAGILHHEKPLVDTLLPEDKETDAFLDKVHKKKFSNEIRQKNQEKKLQA
jgi:hypothetical protein